MSDLDRISYLFQNTSLREEVQERIETELLIERNDGELVWDFRKSKSRALHVKTLGNSSFGIGKNEEALELYSSAIAWMPVDETKGKPYESEYGSIYNTVV